MTPVSNSTAISASYPLGVGVNLANTRNWFHGYVSNLRILKGTALYTSDFTVPTSPLTAVANTQLLLSGTNAQLVDKTRTNNLILNGTATVSASQFKYGASSMKFDGTNNGEITIPYNQSNVFAANDFSIELWMYASSIGAADDSLIFSQVNNATNPSPLNISLYKNSWIVKVYSAITAPWNGINGVTVGTVTQNTWNHIRVSRVGSNIYTYFNGVLTSTSSVGTQSLYANTAPILLGGGRWTTCNFNGYIDDFRLTIGKSRPVFEIPTEEF
jgi:hypothetical protein